MSLGVEGVLRERLLELVGESLRACEMEINRELADSPVQLVRELGEHVALAGGKRLRPILVLLGAALPVHVLTPSATVRRIINMTALAVADANAGR